MTERQKIAIIGGSGKMGRWSAGFLLQEGHEVVITGRSRSKLLAAREQLGIEIEFFKACHKMFRWRQPLPPLVLWLNCLPRANRQRAHAQLWRGVAPGGRAFA